MLDFNKISNLAPLRELLPRRPERSHKGTFGKVLCVCGSYGMAGAAYLSALGAYRSGAGLVYIFTPRENVTILQTLIPEAVIKIYDSDSPDTDSLKKLLSEADSVVVGCGLGKTKTALSLLKCVLKYSRVPTVIDADALNLISEHPFLFKYTKDMIITPHMMEASRLCGKEVEDVMSAPERFASELAHTSAGICLLKDHNTAVSDGERCYINKTGNSGMATGGSGDLLAGMIAGFSAQKHLGLSPFESAVLGAYAHGLAGDAAAREFGEYSLMASDIADFIKI